jgi:hypothetical protein
VTSIRKGRSLLCGAPARFSYCAASPAQASLSSAATMTLPADSHGSPAWVLATPRPS